MEVVPSRTLSAKRASRSARSAWRPSGEASDAGRRRGDVERGPGCRGRGGGKTPLIVVASVFLHRGKLPVKNFPAVWVSVTWLDPANLSCCRCWVKSEPKMLPSACEGFCLVSRGSPRTKRWQLDVRCVTSEKGFQQRSDKMVATPRLFSGSFVRKPGSAWEVSCQIINKLVRVSL